MKTLKIAVLGSTRGSDLQGVIDVLETGTLTDVEIVFVLSNKEDAGILDKARKHGLNPIFLDPTGKSREEYDDGVTKLCEDENIELILLIGYMKLMSNSFVDKWRNKVMNIHPSLLPLFAGGMDTNVHQEVLDAGMKESGCSLIFIDEGADTGPIILQKKVDVIDGETVDTLKDKVQKAEVETIIRGIELFRDGKLKVNGHDVHIVE